MELGRDSEALQDFLKVEGMMQQAKMGNKNLSKASID